jgi:uncharacterized membrane protein (DUF2068 family)
MKKIAPIIVAFTVVALLAYGGWQLKRWFNWEFQYESYVKQTIREMVKEECLKKE